jgi:L-ascorbate metabolism protein UlaG (beta-lactamase superfamily)
VVSAGERGEEHVLVTHFGHACVLVELGATRILLDPGEWSDGFSHLRGLHGILVTHKHPDHLYTPAIQDLMKANPGATLAADPESTAVLSGADLAVTVARPGDTVQIGDVTVRGVGGQHAMVHSEIPILRNTGYLLGDGEFYHPGDSFFVPETPVGVLGLPTGAPWLKIAEVVDFMRLISPRVALPIHERALARPQVHYNMFTNLAPGSTEVRVLDHGKELEL